MKLVNQVVATKQPYCFSLLIYRAIDKEFQKLLALCIRNQVFPASSHLEYNIGIQSAIQ